MSKENSEDVLRDLRREIDLVDVKILDLLSKRTELVVSVGAAKKKSKGAIVHPEREAMLIKKLLSRHKGAFPQQSIIRIWREMVGAFTTMQTSGAKVAVTEIRDENGHGSFYIEMAKDYFSSVLPMKKASNPLSVMTMVREGDVMFGVMPWPEDGAENPWWYYMKDETGVDGMHIIARLPFADQSGSASPSRSAEAAHPEHRGLVIGRMDYKSSGEDRSFLGLELTEDISRGFLVDKLTENGFTVLSVASAKKREGMPKLHIVEVDGFVDAEDKQISKVQAAIHDPEARFYRLGGYTVPPVLKA